ncbi:hypothetical protein JCM8547_000730 [Rhodosporidiobolus lusitaniae]
MPSSLFQQKPPTMHLDKPLSSTPIRLKAAKSFLGAFKRLPQALQAKKEAACSLQRRPAIRIKVQRRETFVFQTAPYNPQPLPDPALLGNRLLVGERDRHRLARATLLAHIHPLLPLQEDTPYLAPAWNGSSSTCSLSIPTASSVCSSPSSDPSSTPRSWFSDDSSIEEVSSIEGSPCPSDDEDDFPEDEGARSDDDDEDLTSNLDVVSFVSQHGEQGRWSVLYDGLSSPSPSSSRSTTPYSSPRTPSRCPLPSLNDYLPFPTTSLLPAPLERPHRRPMPVNLDDFNIILTEEPPSPRRRTRRSSLPVRESLGGKNDERRGSTETI